MDFVRIMLISSTLSMICYILFLVLWKMYDAITRGKECYVLDFQCFKPSEQRAMYARFYQRFVRTYSHRDVHFHTFVVKSIVNSGIGEQAYGPRTILASKSKALTLAHGISEMDEFFHDSIQKLFQRSNISPRDIDVLVVNVSMITFLAARIINHYKMRSDIKVFNLSGMGCSANLISISLVRNIFKSHKNVVALVVSTESLGPNQYEGVERSMMLPNCLFRSGGCVIALTNGKSCKSKAILKLKHLVRVHHGARDDAFSCCTQMEDEEGLVGVRLSRELPKVAARALVENLTAMAPKILLTRELVRYMVTLVKAKLIGNSTNKRGAVKINLMSGLDHICIHPGGKAVIDGVEKSLELSKYDVEPSRMTLHRFGNMSWPSLWYIVAYMEAKKRLKRGEKVMMIGFGSGFKCNSCVWEVGNIVKDWCVNNESENIWNDCIGDYPRQYLGNPFAERYLKHLTGEV